MRLPVVGSGVGVSEDWESEVRRSSPPTDVGPGVSRVLSCLGTFIGVLFRKRLLFTTVTNLYSPTDLLKDGGTIPLDR